MIVLSEHSRSTANTGGDDFQRSSAADPLFVGHNIWLHGGSHSSNRQFCCVGLFAKSGNAGDYSNQANKSQLIYVMVRATQRNFYIHSLILRRLRCDLLNAMTH
jgi:hypothetical protein